MKEFQIHTTIKSFEYDDLPAEYKALVDVAKEMTTHSYAPYSHFCVGAALLLNDGSIVRGCNQENAAYPSGLCAERTAMFAASANHPDKAMKVLAIAAFTDGHFTEQPVSPCGGCRQVMVEFEDRQKEPLTVVLYGTKGTYVVESAKELMPFCFVAESLKGN
ncbi:MAG: cytidine deaminase [Paludibacteraceae bacterium]|nr:cytidine deaminase [Paludibacteraceae bacterium]